MNPPWTVLQQALESRLETRLAAQHLARNAEVRAYARRIDALLQSLAEVRQQIEHVAEIAQSPRPPPPDPIHDARQNLGLLSRSLADHRIRALEAVSRAREAEERTLALQHQVIALRERLHEPS